MRTRAGERARNAKPSATIATASAPTPAALSARFPGVSGRCQSPSKQGRTSSARSSKTAAMRNAVSKFHAGTAVVSSR